MERVLFYCDVGGYGGHEIMAVLIMREMIARRVDVHFAFLPKNDRLFAEASQVRGLNIHPLMFSLNRFSYLTNRFDLPKTFTLRKLIRGVKPDCIVAVQGTMGIASLVLLAAKREKVPVISYIALAQSMRELGLPSPRLKDAVLSYYFTLPDRFITIGECQKSHLIERGVPAGKISVIPNVAPFKVVRSHDRLYARELLNIEQDKTWFGLIGRVFAHHKGHDYLVSSVNRHRNRLKNERFLIVGDGPDLDRIKRRVGDEYLKDFFSFKPWTEEMNLIYSALDAVLMPSNHEGVPLVMIEAGLFGLPVVASAIDGMKEYLPPEWLFPRGDMEGMMDRILHLSTTDQSLTCSITQERFRRIFLRTTIGQEFAIETEKTAGFC